MSTWCQNWHLCKWRTLSNNLIIVDLSKVHSRAGSRHEGTNRAAIWRRRKSLLLQCQVTLAIFGCMNLPNLSSHNIHQQLCPTMYIIKCSLQLLFSVDIKSTMGRLEKVNLFSKNRPKFEIVFTPNLSNLVLNKGACHLVAGSGITLIINRTMQKRTAEMLPSCFNSSRLRVRYLVL